MNGFTKRSWKKRNDIDTKEYTKQILGLSCDAVMHEYRTVWVKKELRLQSELNLRRRTLQTVRNKIDVNKRVTYCGGKNFITQVCFIWQGRVSGWLMNDCDLYCSDKDTACNADESRCKSVGVCNQRWPEWSSRQHRAGGWGMRFGVVLPGGPWKGDTIKLQFLSVLERHCLQHCISDTVYKSVCALLVGHKN